MTFQPVLNFLRSTTARLALSYLAIIMVLSIGFSFVIYKTSARELERQIPPTSLFITNPSTLDNGADDYHYFWEQRVEEGRALLAGRLVLLNLVVLAGGAGFSYYLARRTLEPIEKVMEAQSRFVTDASHELRTPLTAMLAGNEVALRKPKLTLPQAKKIIASNTEEIIRLKELSDNLLGLSRLEMGNMNYQPVSLQDVAKEAMNRVISAAQVKHMAIKDTVPAVVVHGDLPSLVQAVTVLLDNAIKYSPEKSTIHLGGREKDGRGYISVRDEGPGIAADDLPHIFERFYRVDPSRTASATSGHGIGLSIAQKVVEQHGGKITVKSAPGRGSTFSIRLPLA